MTKHGTELGEDSNFGKLLLIFNRRLLLIAINKVWVESKRLLAG